VKSERAAYWDRVADDWALRQPQRLWRHYSDVMNARLLAEWLPPGKLERVLKTDAFDEAAGDVGLHPRLAAGARSVVGIDLSVSMLRRARARHASFRAAGADVRDAFVRLLLAFEGLSRWPTRYLAGYFIAVAAVRR
jgi:hypothetical protein